MKVIMKSIKPKQCANIMNLIQSVLVIKNKREATAIQKLIDENGYAEFYVYCSKGKEKLITFDKYLGSEIVCGYDCTSNKKHIKYGANKILNGKVIFKFRCYKVDEFTLKMIKGGLYFSKSDSIDFPNEEAQLDNFELLDYAGEKLGTKLYTIHISDLEIFDRPRKISEFMKINATGNCWDCKIFGSGCLTCQLTKAPRSFTYVEVESK